MLLVLPKFLWRRKGPARRPFGRVAAAVGVGVVLGSTAPVLSAGPASAITVQVEPGETLSSIAAEYGTTVAALAAANGITNPNLIYAGTVLQLPSSASPGTVTVAAGETLTSIAEEYGTTVDALAAANDITNLNFIEQGQVIDLPSGGNTTAAVTPTSVTVGPGETLTSIAQQFGTTVSALADANDIGDPNSIYAGATLLIPSTSTSLASFSTPAGGDSAALPAELLAHPSRLGLYPDFTSAAATYGVPASLLEALCWWESGWQTSVLSVTGAIGVCQIEPQTASFVDDVLFPQSDLDPYVASQNIDIGAAFLANLLDRTAQSESLAVAAYYQGLQSVETEGMLPTTENYVNGILAYSSIFAAAS